MNILITSVGRRSYLVNYFKKALGENGLVHVANSTDITPSFIYADKSVVTPLIYDKNYVPFLKKYCIENDINMIISLFDIDLYILAKHREEFRRMGIEVIVSDANFISICNDKWKTYNYLNNYGFNVPKTYIKLEDVIKDLDSGKINYPIIIKPRWGMGSLSIFTAENIDELKVLSLKIRKDIVHSYMKYESSNDIENCVIFQEKLDGQEYGIDIINDLNGNYKNTIVRQKLGMRAGETDCAIIENNENVKKIGAKLGKLTKHVANLDVDLFFANDNYYILEMNARFGGGYPFGHMAGVDLPLAIVSWCMNKEIDEKILTNSDVGIYYKDITLIAKK